jgi:SAM-dependent methyltransferase
MRIGDSRIVMSRRSASSMPASSVGYKGLAIHARAELHDEIGRIVAATLTSGALVLDVAAGSGAMCRRLQDLGFTPTACDIVSEKFRLHGDVDFFEIDLNQHFPDHFRAMFDCVIAMEIIEHLENPWHFLRQCFFVLRPGGLLVVSTPNIGSPASRAAYARAGKFRWFDEHNYEMDGHITPITLSGMCIMLTSVGFNINYIASVSPIGGKGIFHWRTRLLVGLIRLLARDKPLPGDILVISGHRPT